MEALGPASQRDEDGCRFNFTFWQNQAGQEEFVRWLHWVARLKKWFDIGQWFNLRTVPLANTCSVSGCPRDRRGGELRIGTGPTCILKQLLANSRPMSMLSTLQKAFMTIFGHSMQKLSRENLLPWRQAPCLIHDACICMHVTLCLLVCCQTCETIFSRGEWEVTSGSMRWKILIGARWGAYQQVKQEAKVVLKSCLDCN